MKHLSKLFLICMPCVLLMTSCADDVDNTQDDDVVYNQAIDAWANAFSLEGNLFQDPNLNADYASTLSVFGSLSAPQNPLVSTNYKGAISPNTTPWYQGWSVFDNIVQGNTTTAPLPNRPTRVISDNNGRGTGTTTWSNDTTYILDGFVFINSGDILNIEAGTIIKGRQGQGENSSALIVANGGIINAVGTATEPIIFTFEGDNGNTSIETKSQWGGLIIMGNAKLNTLLGVNSIEGIPQTDVRAFYGGNDEEDNSGILKYVSIRHGGSEISPGNEINGLTLAGVGNQTTIDYVEVVSNSDDGIEWFGGSVVATHLISAYNSDDALDYDIGYNGKNQFVIVFQDPADADRGGEHDGGTNPEDGFPYATPSFYNVTSIGNSTSKAITFRDNAGGEYHNSIFLNYGNGIDIEYLGANVQDSYQQFQDGNLVVRNNIFFNLGAGTIPQDVFSVTRN